MKAIKFFAMLFACAAMSFTFASCGDDDDDINGGDPGEIITGQTTSKYTKDSKNELEVTQKSAVVTQVHNAKFDKDGILTSYTITSTWGTEEWANAYYEEMKNESDMKVSKKGKTVTVDMTSNFEGATYDLIKRMFDAMIAESGKY